MAGDQATGKVLLCCAAALLLLMAGAVGSSVPFWQPGYSTVTSEPFDVHQMEMVELNSAGIEELCSLSGLGEKKAQAILEYRQEHGPFSSLDELEQVTGISTKSIDAWRSRLYIEADEMQKEER